MITPESNWAVYLDPEVESDGPFYPEPVPAAGWLGVLEEQCPALHTEESLSEEGIPFPCPSCGATA